MPGLPWSLTIDRGAPWCAKILFFETELDATKAAVQVIAEWIPGRHSGKTSFDRFLDLALESRWDEALAEGMLQIRKAGGKNLVAIMQIAPQTFSDEQKIFDRIRWVLYQPERGSLDKGD